LLALFVSPIFAAVFFANIFIWNFKMRAILCPQSSAPLYQNADDFHEVPRIVRAPAKMLKTSCHVCGCDLTRRR